MECSTSVCKVEALFQFSLAGFSALNWYERVVTNQLTVLIFCLLSDRISFGPFNEAERILRDELDPLKEKFQIASAFFKAMSDLWPFGAPIVGLGVPGVKQPLEGLIGFIVQCREFPKRHGLQLRPYHFFRFSHLTDDGDPLSHGGSMGLGSRHSIRYLASRLDLEPLHEPREQEGYAREIADGNLRTPQHV